MHSLVSSNEISTQGVRICSSGIAITSGFSEGGRHATMWGTLLCGELFVWTLTVSCLTSFETVASTKGDGSLLIKKKFWIIPYSTE